MSQPGITERLSKNIEEMRQLVAEYNTHTDDDQKMIRHQLYTHLGGFAREVTPLYPKFKAIEEKLK